MNRNLDFYYLWLSTLEDSPPACWHTFPILDANWEKWDPHKHMFSLNYHYGDRVQFAFIGNSIYTLCVLMKPLGSEENFWHIRMSDQKIKASRARFQCNSCCLGVLSCSSSDMAQVCRVFAAFTFAVRHLCSEPGETLRGCSSDRWGGNVRIGIKQRRKRRAGREGGEDEKTGSGIRFSLVTALYFPYQ